MATVHDNPELMTLALSKPHPEPLCKCEECVAAINARNEIVLRMKHFLMGISSPIARLHRCDAEDLLHVAIATICQKFHHFKPELGFSPLTYFGGIAWRVMSDYASRDSVIRPSHCWRDKDHLLEMGIKAKKAKSLDQMTCSDSDGVLDDMGSDGRNSLEDYRESAPEVKAGTSEASDIVHEALMHINQRFADVIRLRLQGETLSQIGTRLKLSRERIRQIEELAHKQLHKAIKEIVSKNRS